MLEEDKDQDKDQDDDKDKDDDKDTDKDTDDDDADDTDDTDKDKDADDDKDDDSDDDSDDDKDDDADAKIPRSRLNEEIEKKHALEEEVRSLKEKVGDTSKDKQANVYEEGIKKLKDKGYDQDDIDTILNIADGITQSRLSSTQATTGEIIRGMTVDKIIKSNPAAEKFKDELDELTKKIPSKYRTPQLIEMKCYEHIGRRLSGGKAFKEAESMGRKKEKENKKIAKRAGTEDAGASKGKEKKVKLTDKEKAYAKKFGMTDEEYIKNKK